MYHSLSPVISQLHLGGLRSIQPEQTPWVWQHVHLFQHGVPRSQNHDLWKEMWVHHRESLLHTRILGKASSALRGRLNEEPQGQAEDASFKFLRRSGQVHTRRYLRIENGQKYLFFDLEQKPKFGKQYVFIRLYAQQYFRTSLQTHSSSKGNLQATNYQSNNKASPEYPKHELIPLLC